MFSKVLLFSRPGAVLALPSSRILLACALFAAPFWNSGQAQAVTAAGAAGSPKESAAPSDPRPRPDIPKSSAVHNGNQSDNDYRIGAGDVLHISVWKEPEVSVQSIVVRPDGKITMPLIKDIDVGGLTPAQVEKIITAGLTDFIDDPDVTVIVTGINSKKIYVIGGVKKEGPIAYTYRMSVMQALMEAGGLTDYAKRKKIYVLRAENGKENRIPFDYDSILNGKQVERIFLQPNDTLVVPH